MDLFEKAALYQQKMDKHFERIPEIEQQIKACEKAVSDSLQNGDSEEFFKQNKLYFELKKELEEIENIPANNTGVTAQEVKSAWEKHIKEGSYQKSVYELFKARQAFKSALENTKKAFNDEVKTVEKFRSSAASGCSSDFIQEIKNPRGLRWREISKIDSGIYFGPFGMEYLKDSIQTIEDMEVYM